MTTEQKKWADRMRQKVMKTPDGRSSGLAVSYREGDYFTGCWFMLETEHGMKEVFKKYPAKIKNPETRTVVMSPNDTKVRIRTERDLSGSKNLRTSAEDFKVGEKVFFYHYRLLKTVMGIVEEVIPPVILKISGDGFETTTVHFSRLRVMDDIIDGNFVEKTEKNEDKDAQLEFDFQPKSTPAIEGGKSV